MAHSAIRFDLWRYPDGSLHLNYEDSLHGRDVYLIVNPDGTLTHDSLDDDGDDVLVPVGNLYEFLSELWERDGQ